MSGETASTREAAEWLQASASGAFRICSVCVGAFILAAAGLLAGRQATTHWSHLARLQKLYPKIDVLSGPIFVRDENIWTSAGVSAGIDMALHIVEEDFDRKVAMDVAKTLVVFLRRPGDQNQFSIALGLQSKPDPTFSALLSWAADHLTADLSILELAKRAGMSPRTFARKFVAAVGHTPGSAMEALRFDAAKRMLEEQSLPLKQIAKSCGFVDEQSLRRAFSRLAGVSPGAYRERFGAVGHPLRPDSAHGLDNE